MEHTVSKVDVALVHLRTAIQLYNINNFISAITLAGAAEDILRNLAEKKSGRSSAIDEKIFVDQLASYLEKPKPSFEKVLRSRNRLKNELKHNDNGEDSLIREDFRFEAETFILGAIKNYALITGEEPKDRVIRRWSHTVPL